jgi:hypothetical protein
MVRRLPLEMVLHGLAQCEWLLGVGYGNGLHRTARALDGEAQPEGLLGKTADGREKF